ncbi:hypothetical protein Mapa_006406 [Marchantia paleacea]|nr:hypothetical protein Mapa_006406 [Marchantia paleacea]
MALSRAIAPRCSSRAPNKSVVLGFASDGSSVCSSTARVSIISPSGNGGIPMRLGTVPLRSTGSSVISRKNVTCSAMAPAASTEEEYAMDSPKMKELMAFLEKDLPHLFDEQGIDKSMYDEKVDFVDPITKYNSLGGYLFNIQMLRRLFEPIFELHSLKQTGPTEITTRWTMTMTPVLLPWRPQLIFTGTSVMTVNPETGRFNSHVDFWDSIKNNDYFSFEALQDVVSQLQIYKTPDLETPKYRVLKRTGSYEVRQYEQFLVAETPSDELVGNKGFNEVAGYLFGKNTTGEKMKMTTPVFNLSAGEGSQLQFVLPLKSELSTVPGPLSEQVKLRAVDKTFAAAVKFNGQTTEELIREKESKLRAAVINDGLQPEEGYLLARYNDPGRTKPFMRRNEVIIWLKDFSLEV